MQKHAIPKEIPSSSMTKRSRLYSRNNEWYVCQQDRTSHTSRVTQAHLEEATPEFTKKDECPP